MGVSRMALGTCLVALLAVNLGCSGKSSLVEYQVPSASVAQPATARSNVALPAPQTLRVSAAAETNYACRGGEFDVDLPHQNLAATGDNFGFFSSAGSDANGGLGRLAFGCYEFRLGPDVQQTQLHFAWDTHGWPPGNGWVALSNYQRDRWDWTRLPENDVLAVDVAENCSPEGVLYVCIAMAGPARCILHQLCLSVPPDPGPWPMYGLNPQHNRLSPYAGPQSGTLKWQFSPTGPGWQIAEVHLAPDGAIVTREGGVTIWVLNANGSVRWRSEMYDFVSNPLVSTSGVVYFYTMDTSPAGSFSLCAINLADGSARWIKRFDNYEPYPNPIACNANTLYCVLDGVLIAFDINGNPLWELDLDLSWDATLANVGPDDRIHMYSMERLWTIDPTGVVLSERAFNLNNDGVGAMVLAADGSLYVSNSYWLGRADVAGNLLWKTQTGWQTDGLPAVSDSGNVYVTEKDGDLLAFAADGTQQWQQHCADSLSCMPVITTTGLIYTATENGGIYQYSDSGYLNRLQQHNDCFKYSPAVASDGTVYIGSTQGQVYAYDSDGALQWQQASTACLYGEAIIDHSGAIYLSSRGQEFCVLDPNGVQQWVYDTSSFTQGSLTPVIRSDGMVIVPCNSNIIIGLDENHELSWTKDIYSSGYEYYSSIVMNSIGMLYLPVYPADIIALDADHENYWTFRQDTEIQGESYVPATDQDGNLYASTTRGYLVALTKDGTQQWIHKFGTTSYTPAVIGHDGTIYVSDCNGSPQSSLIAFATNGDEKWRYPLCASGEPAVANDGSVYIGDDFKHQLVALNADGSLRWSYETGAVFSGNITLGADGTIYAGCTDHYLYAVDNGGNLKWRFKTQGPIYSAPTIGADGSLYLCGYDGTLYAFAP